MTWVVLTVVAVAVVAGLLVHRRRTLTAIWSWNDVALQVVIGMRLTEVYFAELRAISIDGGNVIFETARGDVVFESRWLVPKAVTLLSGASGQTQAGIVRALKAPGPTELWRGETGTFRAPISP